MKDLGVKIVKMEKTKIITAKEALGLARNSKEHKVKEWVEENLALNIRNVASVGSTFLTIDIPSDMYSDITKYLNELGYQVQNKVSFPHPEADRIPTLVKWDK